MGLLSSIVEKVKSIGSDIKTVYKGGDVSASQGKVATGIINAVATIGQSFNPFSPIKPAVNEKIVKSPTLQAVGNFVVKNPYTTAAIVAVPASGSLKTVAKKVVSTTAGKIIAATAVATAPAAIVSSKVRTGIINTAASVTPEKIISLSANVGQAVETPSKTTITDILKENKDTLITLGGVAAAIGIGKVGATAITAGLLADDNDTKVEVNTPPTGNNTSLPAAVTATAAPNTAAAAAAPPVAQTAPVYATTSGSGTSTKRKKRKITPPMKISQRVNVVVSQRQNNKYIKRDNVPILWA